MKLYLVTPAHDDGGHDFDQLVVANSPKEAVCLLEKALVDNPSVVFVQESDADPDSVWLARELPTLSAGVYRVGIMDWSECMFTFWRRYEDDIAAAKAGAR